MPKGIYDRSKSAWRPPAKRQYPAELVAKVRELYESGLTIAEVQKLVPGCKVQKLMVDHNITRRPRIKRDQSGPRNASWKGSDAGYQALHLRVESARGKPKFCACCDTADPGVRYEWANLSGRYDDITDYVRLCVTCHRRLDVRRRQELGHRTSPKRGR